MPSAPFADRPRFDAHDKVTGAATYVADIDQPGQLFAMTVPAGIAKGRIVTLPTRPALDVAGVVRVLTAADFPVHPASADAAAGPPPIPTLTTEIAYRGQPVALVLAETLEAAIEGAEAIRPTYAEDVFSPLIDSFGATREPFKGANAGDADTAFARATTLVEVEYACPNQHHNPIEMLSTTAHWSDGKLVIYEASQGTGVVKANVARSLQLDPSVIEVRSSTIGGGFGQKGTTQRQTAIIAQAAILTGRPVKFVMPRGQIFLNATYRPHSSHKLKIGADASGKMVAVTYDAVHQQSRSGQFPPNYHEAIPQMYDVPDYRGTAANVRIDTQAPGYMRCPHPHPACFAFEGAIDELAYKLGRDPVEFRITQTAIIDPISGHPLSSNLLSECFAEGARRFGWHQRNPTPGATVLTDGTRVGWGVAGGAYPSMTTANIATLRIGADGSTRFAVSAHEMGQGIRTVLAAVLLRELDINPSKLDLAIGDTSVVPQHMTAGSWGTVSAAPVAEKAAREIKARIAELTGARRVNGDLHRQLAAVKRPYVQVEVSQLGPGQEPGAFEKLRKTGYAVSGPEYPRFSSYSYIAHFVEVRVEPGTCRIRVPRVVSIADCGRVISPRTAASQLRGGVVWGVGSALREESEVDPLYGGWLNNDLADYVVPVNLDIGEIEVGFIDRPDPILNTIGAKGMGEVALAGCSAAVGNAIFHATGKRLRKMPIRIEDLL